MQWHIVKPVTLITKVLKWVEDGEEEKEKAQNRGGGVERWREWGRQGTSGYNRQSKLCAGDWESVAGKVTVQQAIRISEPLLTEVGEQDKWKGIILTQGRAEGCWEATCWERLRSHQGMLKTLADSREVQPLTFPIYLFYFSGSLMGMCAQWNMLAILVPSSLSF